MTVKNARKLRGILVLVGFIIMLGGYLWEPLMIIGAIVTISGLIPHFLYNRCPRCRKQLGKNDGEFCQFCGTKLD